MVAYQQRFVAVFNAAITEGHIKVNPFDLIKKNERIAKVRSTKDSLTMDEVERIADVVPVKKEDAEVQRAFLFACFAGIRISDIRELKWTDIKEMGEYKAIVKIQVKTDELVTVPLCKKAMEYLPDQREDEYVFHLPLKTGLRLGLKRIIDAAGIDSPTTFHTSRHTFATLTFASGSDLATVSRLLGHSSVATTEIYADVLMESKVKAMKGISDLFK
jgi:integrase